MFNIVNGKCWAQTALPEPSLFQNGQLVLATHDIGWIISGAFSIIALLVSFWLIWQHLSWYTNKREQRYIVRILLMVPIYAVITFGSYLYYNHSTALLLVRDCYESVVLTSFFYLLLNYLSHDPEEQKDVFRKFGLSREYDRNARRRGRPPSHWVFPMHFVRWKPEDGLYFLQLMKWGVLQYCVVRPTTTLAAVILNYVGLYCEDSWGPGWGHVYITVIMSISVTIAMYCLLQLYMPVSELLAPQKPILKLFAVKAVVFLTFWQATLISVLETFGVIKDTEYMTADNVATGISAIAECVEMALFALLHVKAYTYTVYCEPSASRPSRLRALVHALNFKETLVELWRGGVYMAHRARGRETDRVARRGAAYESVFGKSRWSVEGGGKAREGTRGGKEAKGRVLGVGMNVEEAYVEGERQWLGLDDEHAYGYGYHSQRAREKSDGLEEQIEKELTTRGYRKRDVKERPSLGAYAPVGQDDARTPPARSRTRAWWRDVYARISRTSADEDPSPDSALDPQSQSFKRVHGYHVPQMSLDDPPPRSAIRAYRDSQRERRPPPPSVLHDLVALDPTPGSPPPLSPIQIPPRASPPRRTDAHRLPPAPATSRDSGASSQGDSSQSRRTSGPRSPRDSDSFLGRAFVNLPEPTTSVEQSSTTTTISPPSSQSHRTQVRLCAEPVVLPRALDVARAPVFEGPAKATAAMAAVVTSSRMAQYKAERARRKAPGLQGVPEDLTFEPSKAGKLDGPRARRMSSPPGRLASSRARRSSRADEPKRRSLGGPVSSVSPTSPASLGRATRYTPRGVPIVLPTPLAPAAGQGSPTPPTSPPRTPFSPPGSLGSPSDADYLRRNMT
ncbi:DUF300-domain-containing protein [Daedalea quercina L-15889]|uniref:DUF300-domain-containing protein n=1 Tax=Daedalea quercina L-15889 TaxID=1314783 RepID=A0A165QN52_9APHY|nr:DUF300-domain-containing protein [Daedalea quercina L-15889]